MPSADLHSPRSGRMTRGGIDDGALERSRQETAKALDALVRAERALQESRMLVREVDHRAKNSLQLAAAMLHLQAQGTDSPQVRDRLESAIRRLYSLASIHAGLYQAEDSEETPLRLWLERICQGLAADSPVAVEIDAPEVSWPIEVAGPLSLFVGEAVANALKHAFSTGACGVVRVRLQPLENGRWRLEVADGGDGDGEALKEGLGFRLLRTFARQLEADFSVGRGDANHGVRVAITFAPPPIQPPPLF